MGVGPWRADSVRPSDASSTAPEPSPANALMSSWVASLDRQSRLLEQLLDALTGISHQLGILIMMADDDDEVTGETDETGGLQYLSQRRR